MKENHEKSIIKILNLALVFIYFISICLLNFFSSLDVIPKFMLNIYQPYTDYTPMVDYLRIMTVFLSTICFFMVYLFIKKKIINLYRISKVHTISIIIFIAIFHNIIPFFQGVWSLKYFINSTNGTIEMTISSGTLIALEGWMDIWRFIAVALLLCAYAMYWYKSNFSTITDTNKHNRMEEKLPLI